MRGSMLGVMRPALALAAVLGIAAAPPAAPRIVARARSQRPGELVLLSVTTPRPVKRLHARAFGHEVAAIATGRRTWQALVGIDLGVKPGTYTVAFDADEGAWRTSYDLVVRRRVFPTRRLTVDDAFVNPPASEEARIERESALLADTWRSPAPDQLWTAPFVTPVAEPANSRFGTRSIFNGVPLNPHGGADFPSREGTPVHAPNAGRIAIARDLYFSGNTVVIDHGLGLFSMLAHLSVIDVQEGNTVASGEVVGRVGATGRVTGPHLHWAVRVNGARVDPLSVLALLGGRGR